MFLKKIFSILNRKFIWKFPNKSTILIYDEAGYDILKKNLSGYSTEIFPLIESINIPILIIAIINMVKYQFQFIDYVNPKILITYIDNNNSFYRIKNKRPHLTTIFIQNGIRSNHSFSLMDLGSNENYVDFMFCFNDAVSFKYKEYITGETVSIGSFKSNSILPINKIFDKLKIVYISQFRKFTSFSDPFIIFGNSNVSFEAFYSCEFYFLPKILAFCIKNDFELQICGCSIEDYEAEFSFYKLILPEAQWIFSPKKSIFSSYETIDSSYCVISCGSTLGLEALARNKRVAFFTSRGYHINSKDYDFGWPDSYDLTGPFWTNIENEEIFNTVMNFVFFSNEKTWNDTIGSYRTKLIETDFANNKFSNVIKSVLNKNQNDYTEKH